MKPSQPVSREQLLLTLTLTGLLLLGLALWLVDTSHQPVGPSRFVGPPATPAKP